MKENVLDMLADVRLEGLDESINADEEYRSARKEQMQIQEKLETMGLSAAQKAVVEELLVKATQNSAIYGKMVYKQGFKDGAKCMHEILSNY